MINYLNENDETPIMIVVKNGYLEIANLLLKKGAEINEALKEAILHNDISKAQEIESKLEYSLPKRRTQIIKQLTNMLNQTVEWGEIKLFIEKNIPEYKLTLEKMYIEEDSKEIKDLKKAFTTYIIEISTQNPISMLEEIEQMFSKDCFTKILNFNHVDIEETVLIAAIELSQSSPEDRVSMISWFLDKNVDTCMCNSKGQTPLIRATIAENFEIVQKILEHSTASLNLKDDKSRSALIYAVRKENLTIFNYLLEAKAAFDPNKILPLAAGTNNLEFTLEVLESLIIATVKQRAMNVSQLLPVIQETLCTLSDKIDQDNIIESYHDILDLLERYEKENNFSKNENAEKEEKSVLKTFGLLQPTQVSLESTKNTDLRSTTDLNSTSASRPK